MTRVTCPVRVCVAEICPEVSIFRSIHNTTVKEQCCESDLHRSLNLHIGKHHTAYQ